MGMFKKKKRKERNTPVGPSPGRGGLRLQRRPLGKWRLREGGLESAQWYTEGKESTHPVTLGSVLPQSDHLRKHKVEGNRADWPTSNGFHHGFIILKKKKTPIDPIFNSHCSWSNKVLPFKKQKQTFSMWIRQTTIWLQISSLNFSIGSICKTNRSSSIKDQHKIQSGCCKCNNAVLLCKMLDNVLWTDVFLALLLHLLALCEEKKSVGKIWSERI